MRALVALLLAPAVLASSFPDGVGKANCDALAKDYFGKGNPVMDWVEPPVRSDDYTVRTGDSTCIADPTSYVPGEYLNIYVRTTRAKWQFRGILLYAVAIKDSVAGTPEKAIGDWEIVEAGTSSMFFLPQNCLSKAVMHTTAQIKYYLHTFRFKAPAAGTGKIAFRALIKRGEANLGEFYFPMLKGDLTLNEQTNIPTRSWYLGGMGATCAATCAANGGKTCDAAYMAQMPTLDQDAYKQISRHYTCSLPLLSDCSGPSQDLSNGNCFFPNTECPIMPPRDYCNAPVPATTAALCACGSVGGPPPQDTKVCQFQFSAGTRVAGSSMLTWAVLLVSSLFVGRSSRSTLLLVIVVAAFVCLPSASAHNWVRSPSRSRNEASTLKPCRNRFDESNPHFQISPGQTFEIEWATGHDWYFAFVVAKAEDFGYLANYTERMIEEYINGCVGTVCTNQIGLDGGKWEKFHLEPVTPTRATYDTQYPGHFAGKADPPIGIERHPRFGNTDVTYWRYIPDYSANVDVRAEYHNPKYPWIHAIHRFKMVGMSRPGNADVARFTINPRPAGYQGKYIVNYFWRGYYDCVDVDVFNTPVASVYGRIATADDNIWGRVDHCQFEEIQGIETSCRQVITTPQRCLDLCTPRQNCLGVNVVPMWNPTTVYHGFQKMMNLPFDGVGMGGMGAGCSRNMFASSPDNTMVCYGVRPRLPNFTHSEYTIVMDPEDPIFYSTCYLKTADWLFDLRLPGFETKVPDTSKTPWAYGPKCISCEDRKFVTLSSQVPIWKLHDHCRNCDTDPDPTAGRNSTPVERLATGVRCDGQTNTNGLISWEFRGKFGGAAAQCADRTKCVKDLVLLGWTTGIDEDECVALAQADPDCSTTVMYRRATSGVFCQCWRTESCCGSCSPNDKAFNNYQWNVLRVGTPTPDPNCATGVKSADGAYCCPSTCVDPVTGLGTCMPKPIIQISFQPSLMVAPAGWWVDNGAAVEAKAGTGYSWGWNPVQLESDLIDSFADDGTSPYSTGIAPGRSTTNKTPLWTIGPLANGTYRVELLFGNRNTGIQTSACTLEGSRASYSVPGASTLIPAQTNAWEVRDVVVSDGILNLVAGTNCAQLNGIRIWPKAIVSASGFNDAKARCESQDGMCCPANTEAANGNRPCSKFGPPCSNPSGGGPAPTVPPTNPPTAATTRGPTAQTTGAPVANPTAAPVATTGAPVVAPTAAPVVATTRGPTAATTGAPVAPTAAPVAPTGAPVAPTAAPVAPTAAPVVAPTGAPVSRAPTNAPVAPTAAPVAPTAAPVAPTGAPVVPPTPSPST